MRGVLEGRCLAEDETTDLKNSSPYFGKMINIFEKAHSLDAAVLDLGCGPAVRDLRLLEDMGVPQLVGIDIRNLAGAARSGSRIECIHSDIGGTLPIADERFDFVVMDNVVEHLYDPRKTLTECLRVLRKRGSLVLLTPNQARLTNRLRLLLGRSIYYPLDYWIGTRLEAHVTKDGAQVFAGHIREYTASELTRMLRIVGFDVVSVEVDIAARPSLREEGSRRHGALFAYNIAERTIPGAGYMINVHARKP